MGVLSQGVHGSGGRSFSPEQEARVLDCLTAWFEVSDEPVTVEQLSAATAVPGRTVREIVSRADGVSFLLGGDGARGYQLASDALDARRYSARIESQARTMEARSSRRLDMTRRVFGEDGP